MIRSSLVWILLFTGYAQAAEIIDRIVAKVDNSIITASDIEEAAAASVMDIRSKYPADQWEAKISEIRQLILRQLIDEFVLAKAARDAGILVPDEEVGGYIENLWKKAGIPNEEQFKIELKKEGLKLEELSENLKRQALAKKILQREVYSKIAVTELDLKQYYEENKSIYHQSARVKVALLLLPVTGKDEDDWNNAKTEIDAISARLKQGAEFARMVKDYSKGPAVDEGGDIGFLEKGKGLPEFESVAFALSNGEISEPFRTQHGWNIIRVESTEPEGYRSFAEARSEIENLVQQLKARDLEREFIEKQRTKTYIENVSSDLKK